MKWSKTQNCARYVRAFLTVAQPTPIFHEKPPPVTREKPIASTEEKMSDPESNFYCRYCGAENKTDARFCEKCGRNIE